MNRFTNLKVTSQSEQGKVNKLLTQLSDTCWIKKGCLSLNLTLFTKEDIWLNALYCSFGFIFSLLFGFVNLLIYKYFERKFPIYSETTDQGPVARSLVSANRWLRDIKSYRFPWCLSLVSDNHASSNRGQLGNYLILSRARINAIKR